MKTALKQIELARVEESETTASERNERIKLFIEGLGPEAQAEIIKSLGPAILTTLI